MRACTQFVATAAVLAAMGSATLSADRVKLRSGQIVDGEFMSADVKRVRILLPNGSITEFPLEDISAVEFSPRGKTAPAPRTASPAPQPTKAPGGVTIPAGTVLSVRLAEAVDVDTAHVGKMFRALLTDAVSVGGKVVVPKEAAVGVMAVNAGALTLKATSIAFGGRRYKIATSDADQKGSAERLKLAADTRLRFTLTAEVAVRQ